jgi:hypothetical protein
MKTFKEYINNSPSLSHEKAINMIRRNKEVPQELIDSMKNAPNLLYGFVETLLQFSKKVPQDIINHFKEDIIKNMPIERSWSKRFYDLLMYYYNENELKDFLQKNKDFMVYM